MKAYYLVGNRSTGSSQLSEKKRMYIGKVASDCVSSDDCDGPFVIFKTIIISISIIILFKQVVEFQSSSYTSFLNCCNNNFLKFIRLIINITNQSSSSSLVSSLSRISAVQLHHISYCFYNIFSKYIIKKSSKSLPIIINITNRHHHPLRSGVCLEYQQFRYTRFLIVVTIIYWNSSKKIFKIIISHHYHCHHHHRFWSGVCLEYK